MQEVAKVALTDDMTKKFNTYCDFLLSENQKYNLTAITDVSEVWEKHFVDSMLGAQFIPLKSSICDIGCGAGFPSIPLAIARADLKATLVDSLGKRVNFCKELCEKIEVNAQVFHDRAEDFAKKRSNKFDVATARAVAPLNILLEYTAQVVKIGGLVIAYKTDESEAENAKNAEKILGLKLESVNKFVLPSGANRCIIVYRKIKPTPSMYPRGQNKPRKNPL